MAGGPRDSEFFRLTQLANGPQPFKRFRRRIRQGRRRKLELESNAPMAIVKFAEPIAGIRGTVGGVIYCANASGAYVRTYSKPPSATTTKQSAQRILFSTMAAGWKALSSTNRNLWIAWAADPAQELTNSLGEAYYASGFNWYATLGIRASRIARAISATPPTAARPTNPTFTTNVYSHLPHVAITYPNYSLGADDLVVFSNVSPMTARIYQYPGWRECLLKKEPYYAYESIESSLVALYGSDMGGLKLWLHISRQTPLGDRAAPTLFTWSP